MAWTRLLHPKLSLITPRLIPRSAAHWHCMSRIPSSPSPADDDQRALREAFAAIRLESASSPRNSTSSGRSELSDPSSTRRRYSEAATSSGTVQVSQHSCNRTAIRDSNSDRRLIQNLDLPWKNFVSIYRNMTELAMLTIPFYRDGSELELHFELSGITVQTYARG